MLVQKPCIQMLLTLIEEISIISIIVTMCDQLGQRSVPIIFGCFPKLYKIF